MKELSWDKKTWIVFVCLTLTGAYGIFIGAHSVESSLPYFLQSLRYTAEHCRMAFPLCLLSLSKDSFPLALMGSLLSIGFIKAFYRGAFDIYRTKKLIRNFETVPLSETLNSILENMNTEFQVNVVRNDAVSMAFVHGIINPRVYLSTGLISKLDEDELKATLAHEFHHIKERDPLRSFLISLFSNFFFFLPFIGSIKEFFKDASEKAADDRALNFASSLDLASAILKVVQHNQVATRSALANLAENGFLEERVRRLISPNLIRAKSITKPVVGFLTLLLFISLGFFSLNFYHTAKFSCLHSPLSHIGAKADARVCDIRWLKRR